MACDSRISQIREEAARRAAEKAREEELQKFLADLAAGRVRVKRDAAGQLSVDGFAASSYATRGKWCDGCILRAAERQGNWLVRAALNQQGVTGKPFVTRGHGHSH